MTDIWREDIFDNLVRLKRGYDLPNHNIVDGIYPVVASSKIKAYHNSSKAKPPTVVTGRSGTLGKVQYIKELSWPLNTALYSTSFRGNNPQYVYYFLKKMHLENYNSGAGVPTLNQNHLQKLKIKIPPLKVQEKIAAVLSAYDDLIEINDNRINKLEAMIKELYKEWFVRFRFPGWEFAAFDKDVPREWSFIKSDKMLSVVKGKSYKGSEIFNEYVDGSKPFLNLKNFYKHGGYRDNGLKYYTGKYSESQKVLHGDIVMAVTDMTQDRAIVGQVGRVPSLNQSFGVISLDTVKIIPKLYSNNFTYFYLRYSGFAETIKEFANGANVLHLSPDQIVKQNILIPPSNLVKLFDSITIPLFENIECLLKINDQLESVKSQLLSRLISGKLSVDDLNIHYPPSMNTNNEATDK